MEVFMHTEQLTIEQELVVTKNLAREIVERLGYEPTKLRINLMAEKIMSFEVREKRVCID
jgi:hypothetical protein